MVKIKVFCTCERKKWPCSGEAVGWGAKIQGSSPGLNTTLILDGLHILLLVSKMTEMMLKRRNSSKQTNPTFACPSLGYDNSYLFHQKKCKMTRDKWLTWQRTTPFHCPMHSVVWITCVICRQNEYYSAASYDLQRWSLGNSGQNRHFY